MLSTTNSVTDVKARLENIYSYYGYTSQLQFTNAINTALEDAQYLKMFPVIGSDYYGDIQAKDKVGLDEIETYLYLAEVHYACVNFLNRRATSMSSSSSSSTKSRLKVEGYEYEEESGSSDGDSSADMRSAIKEFNNKAVHYMTLAGYNPYQLKRGNSMFSDDRTDVILNEGEV